MFRDFITTGLRVCMSITLAAPYLQAVSRLGAISGSVVAENGNPAAGATVTAQAEDRLMIGIAPAATTDAKGKFLLKGLQPGLYTVSAAKEDEFYPNTAYTFYYNGESLPRATVSAGEVTERIVVKLGPKGARITGRVVDATTNAPVWTAHITFYEANSPQIYLSTTVRKGTAEFKLLVPSIRAFRMRVGATGYDTWYHGKDGSEEQATPIQMKPGETKEMTVRLKPSKDSLR